jgi:streptomycin 6-kinase
MVHPSSSLSFDAGVRRRLTFRFGDGIESWFDELPSVLDALAERWNLAFDSVIPRGSVSVVIRCSMHDTANCVLKVSPDRARLTREAAALDQWHTVHTPSVLAVDERAGALLLEAIEPGTPLDESAEYPALERLAELLTALHSSGVPESSYPSVAQRVAYLFDASFKVYQRSPWLVDLVPLEVYEQGRRLATRLAEQPSSTVLVHGDLTPRNVLLGGGTRGLVAIDPAPCVGDPAFDAVDLLLWQADDFETVAVRTAALAPTIGVKPTRMLDWCTAFAGMVVLEMAESATSSRKSIRALAALAVDA